MAAAGGGVRSLCRCVCVCLLLCVSGGRVMIAVMLMRSEYLRP